MANAGDGKIMTQPEKAEHIIVKGCEYFGLSRDMLRRPSKGRSGTATKKRYLSLVLHEYTSYDGVEITEFLGYSDPQNVYRNVSVLKEELSEELYGNERTKRIYNELLSYLNL